VFGRPKEWRYRDIYGGKQYSERRVLGMVRRDLLFRVWPLQMRMMRYSMVPAQPGTQEAHDLSVHLLNQALYQQVHFGMNSAIDHLVGLRALLTSRRAIPAYAAYALIRSSLEGSLGAWRLLSAPTREAAYLEAVASMVKDLRYEASVMKTAFATEGASEWKSVQHWIATGGSTDIEKERDEAIAWATEQACLMGWIKPGKGLPRPSSATANFEALKPDDPEFGRNAYNLLSGGAHGQPWAAATLAWPRDLRSEPAYFRVVTPKMPFIHRYTEMALHWAEVVMTRAEEYRVHPMEQSDEPNAHRA
jgi:hypothetical protein